MRAGTPGSRPRASSSGKPSSGATRRQERSSGPSPEGWNAWKQAARIVEREAELWRDAPAGEELRAIAVKLIQLGYLLPDDRRRILAAIDRAEKWAIG